MKGLKLIALLFWCTTIILQAQEVSETFKNSILSGYHPDPSICRVGDDYYLVNITFVWHLGLPMCHSKGLINW